MFFTPNPLQARAAARPEDEERRSLLPIVGSAKLPPRTEPLPDEMKDASAEVSRRKRGGAQTTAQGRVHDGLQVPCRLYPRVWSSLYAPEQIREGANLLSLEMLMRAEKGQSELAVESACSCFGLARFSGE